MPRLRYLLARRMGPFGIVLTAWDIWRRLPPKQRKRILDATRKHGPRMAAQARNRRRK
ncbi:MAG: hypothetical protein H0U03_07915 [Actinobacteria bacterium]|nr:hypothetical protein [Actinomycetota bacterium]